LILSRDAIVMLGRFVVQCWLHIGRVLGGHLSGQQLLISSHLDIVKNLGSFTHGFNNLPLVFDVNVLSLAVHQVRQELRVEAHRVLL